MIRLGIIGCGKIGGPVIKTIQAGLVDNYEIVSVLTRSEGQLGNIRSVIDADVFFRNTFDLVIDAGAPPSLELYGKRALVMCELWTVNAAELANTNLYEELDESGRQNDHRLRVLTGAIAGLDGLAAISQGSSVEIHTEVDVAPSQEGRKSLFRGSLREAAKLYPDCVNVAVATGLAASKLDEVQIEVIQPGPDEERELNLSASSEYGEMKVKTIPRVIPNKNIHMVSACIIAALRQRDKVIWIG
jgi:aspartate dehydrogenase